MLTAAFVQAPPPSLFLRHATTCCVQTRILQQPTRSTIITTVLRKGAAAAAAAAAAAGGGRLAILDAATAAATSSLVVVDPAVRAAAMSFFNGIRIPATLIAGSSIVALFSMTEKARDTSGMRTMEIVLLRLYHILSLLSFCLSMTAVLTSTSASTMLLLQKYQVVTAITTTTTTTTEPNMDVYSFLRSVMDFEFTMTRWSFLTSLFCFLSAATGRVVLEFDLWTKKRRLAGFMVFSKMTAVLSLLLSYVNTSLYGWKNLWEMGKDVAMVRRRSVRLS
jgi:hypothetical protein